MDEVVVKERSSKDLGLEIIDWTRDLFPESRDELEYIAGVDGSKHHPKALGDRFISITFRVVFFNEKELAQIAGDISDWLHTIEFTKIEVNDEPDIYYMGKVLDDSDLTPELFRSEFTIIFTCYPLKFGEERTITIEDSDPTEEDEEPKGITFNNNGRWESPPVITLTIKEDTEEFKFKLNDAEIIYKDEERVLSANDEITIDSKEFEFKVNGELRVLEVEGHFPDVIKGENVVDTSNARDIEIYYQELYL